MNTAEWILVAILSLTLFIFLILGIVLVIKLLGVSGEMKKVISNVKGMTSIGGTVEMFVEKYINPKLKEKAKERKEDDKGKDK